MKLSTRGRYGARAMLDLALHYQEGTVLLKDIAVRQGISRRYLGNIMATLVCSGLVKSMRGQKGGVTLAKPPEEIRLSQVIEAVEGSIAPVLCVDNPKLCERAASCVTRDIWKRLKEVIWEELNSITLQDMVRMQRDKMKGQKTPIYHI